MATHVSPRQTDLNVDRGYGSQRQINSGYRPLNQNNDYSHQPNSQPIPINMYRSSNDNRGYEYDVSPHSNDFRPPIQNTRYRLPHQINGRDPPLQNSGGVNSNPIYSTNPERYNPNDYRDTPIQRNGYREPHRINGRDHPPQNGGFNSNPIYSTNPERSNPNDYRDTPIQRNPYREPHLINGREPPFQSNAHNRPIEHGDVGPQSRTQDHSPQPSIPPNPPTPYEAVMSKLEQLDATFDMVKNKGSCVDNNMEAPQGRPPVEIWSYLEYEEDDLMRWRQYTVMEMQTPVAAPPILADICPTTYSSRESDSMASLDSVGRGRVRPKGPKVKTGKRGKMARPKEGKWAPQDGKRPPGSKDTLGQKRDSKGSRRSDMSGKSAGSVPQRGRENSPAVIDDSQHELAMLQGAAAAQKRNSEDSRPSQQSKRSQVSEPSWTKEKGKMMTKRSKGPRPKNAKGGPAWGAKGAAKRLQEGELYTADTQNSEPAIRNGGQHAMGKVSRPKGAGMARHTPPASPGGKSGGPPQRPKSLPKEVGRPRPPKQKGAGKPPIPSKNRSKSMPPSGKSRGKSRQRGPPKENITIPDVDLSDVEEYAVLQSLRDTDTVVTERLTEEVHDRRYANQSPQYMVPRLANQQHAIDLSRQEVDYTPRFLVHAPQGALAQEYIHTHARETYSPASDLIAFTPHSRPQITPMPDSAMTNGRRRPEATTTMPDACCDLAYPPWPHDLPIQSSAGRNPPNHYY